MRIKIACKICGQELTDIETFMDYENDQTIVINVGRCEHMTQEYLKTKNPKCFRSNGDGTFEFICDHREFYGG